MVEKSCLELPGSLLMLFLIVYDLALENSLA